MEYAHSSEEVAEFLNSTDLAPGPLSRTGRWTGPAVVRFFKNTILFGRPFRNDKITVKNYETGRRRSQKNPEGRIEIERPDLAFLDPAVEPLLKARFDHYSRTYKRAQVTGDPLEGVARNRSRFPGHCLRCWYCGREYVWGGNGQRDRLMCGGSRQRVCWNSSGVDAASITTAVTTAIVNMIENLPRVETQLVAMIEKAGFLKDGGTKKVEKLESELKTNQEYQENLAPAIACVPDNEALLAELRRLVNARDQITSDLAQAKKTAITPRLPKDLIEITQAFRDILKHDANSYELASLLRPMVISMETHLVRLIDSKKPIPRTRVVLNLLASWPDTASVPIAQELFTVALTVDNEATVPQRARVRETAVRLLEEGCKQRDAAAKLGVTQPAIERACRLTRMMAERNLDTPFVPVISPDELGTKHRRHKHQRYRFQTRDGYVPCPL